MNSISCIFCETESKNTVIEENGYKGRKCPQCGLIYISPRPSFDEIVNLYGHDDAHVSAEAHISADFPKRLYARHNLKILRSVIETGALLEIGAGAGCFLDEARKLGFDPHGLEFNPLQANHIRNELNIRCEESSFDTQVFNGKQFDVVYHSDVISHLFDPISDFRKMNERMKDGAFLVFETGNLGEVDQNYLKYFQLFQYPDHLFFFSTNNLIDLLDRTGFELVKIHRYSILPELMAIKAFSVVRKSIKRLFNYPNAKEERLPEGSSLHIESVADSQSFNAKLFIMRNLRNLFHYFMYLLRYKIGRIALKRKRPQTVVVVARKRRKSFSKNNSTRA